MLSARLAITLVTAIGCWNIAQADEQWPNVILIMADDIGSECFGCYGSAQYQTPHIDRMAERGMRFTHCYAQPLCTPTRVKLMTGLSNVRNYSAFSILPRSARTIGQYFRDAGYRTVVAGKWQLLGSEDYPPRFRGKGSLPADAGFENYCLWQVERRGERYQAPLLTIDGKDKQFDKKKYGPDVCTDYLVEYIEEHRDEPFFAYYPMILVHSPFVRTPDSKARRQGRQRNFEDMVAYMDQLVGRIVQATEQQGIADRTLILFLGDNGTGRGIKSQLDGKTIRGGKGQTTDAGMRVPLVALWPGKINGGAVNENLVDMSDFLPSLLEATGQQPADGLDGVSFYPQLVGEQYTPREWVHCYYNPRPEKTQPKQLVRDKRWKLYADGRFFDVMSDPLEQQPIADDEMTDEMTAAKQKLSAALATFPSAGQSLLEFED
ncbi:sulfatase-like hydrolase/transferase [Aeoliella sp.]|uniref:sulfatase-like hydrolase/transferase n=1 Tax=Aeoliella sp. TaxID=2795800 RepID=UPI003CCBC700